MTIICGTDFTMPAKRAARTAALFAAKVREPLDLVHVAVDAPTAKSARKALAAEAIRLRALCSEVREQMLIGLPDEELCLAAQKAKARLLVVASVGERDPKRWLMGSTAAQVVQSSPVPTIVTRNPDAIDAWLRGDLRLRISVGIDFSDSADAALQWVRELRSIGPCDVRVDHVAWAPEQARRLGLSGDADVSKVLPEIERILLRDLTAKAGRMPGEGDLKLRVDFWDGGVEQRLVMLAKEGKADLAVVGVRRYRPGPDLLWHNLTSRGVARQAPMSVACVPTARAKAPARPIPRIRQVLVATDFSQLGDGAAAYGFALAAGGGTVHLAHVAKKPHNVNRLRMRLQGLIPTDAAARGIDTEVHVLVGRNAAVEICAAAERLGADAVCMGARGESGLAARVLGSVTQKVLAHSKRPVLVIRPPPP